MKARTTATSEQPLAARVRRRKADHGQTLMEFALMLPFLALLGVGVVELGRAIFYTVQVTNAATAGVEYGAQSTLTMVDIPGMERKATDDASLVSAHATFGCTCDSGGGTPAESCSYPVPGPPTVCNSIDCSGGQVVQCVQVTTQATITPIFRFPGLPATYQANGRAVMRVRK